MERGALLLLVACGRSGFDGSVGDGGAHDYASTVLADEPIAYWRFDEAVTPLARDASGHGLDGTYMSVTLGRPGALADANPAVELSGTNGSSIAFGQDFGFDGLAPFTIELWANPSTDNGFLLGKVDWIAADAAYDGWFIYYGPTATTLRRDRIGLDGPALSPGRFNYVVITYDGVTATLFLDGVQRTQRVLGDPMPAVSSPFIIGRMASGQWAQFVGLIDEVALYDRALTPGEVAAHHDIAIGLYRSRPPN